MGGAGLEFPTGSNASPFSFFLARTAVSRSFSHVLLVREKEGGENSLVFAAI